MSDVATGQLRRVLNLPEVIMQSMGVMAPAASVLFTIQLLASLVGIAVPVSLIVAMVLVVMLSVSLASLARRLPSAGGYYTFVREGIGPRWGMFVFVVILVYALTASMNSGFLGQVVYGQLRAAYGIDVPWQVTFLAIVLITGFLAWRGVAVSGRALLVLGSLELSVLVLLGLWGLFDPGRGGVEISAFNPTPVLGRSALYLSIVFALFFFAGWEGSAPIAEETRNPERTMPRALVGSVVLVGLVFVIACWGMTVGWGDAAISGFAKSSQLAPLVLAHRFWGAWWVVLLLALINSVFAISLASLLLCSRMLYALAMRGLLPSRLAQVHPKYGTPANAILGLVGFSVVFGLAMGAIFGPENAYYIYGLAFSLLIIVVYIAGNVAAFGYFYRKRRHEFRLASHVIFPIVTSLVLLYVGYNTVIPFPAYPVGAGIWVGVAWLAIAGAFMVVAVRGRGVVVLSDSGEEGTGWAGAGDEDSE